MKHGMNLSTYANAVNASIALRSVQDNYGAGVGFGMYSSAYDKYIDDYDRPMHRDDIPGRGSAASLFTRLSAELGVIAWAFLGMFFYWAWFNIRNETLSSISISYLATLIIILLRMGEYYANGVILVFLMIYLIRLELKRKPKQEKFNRSSRITQ
ncbi:hypothetical protein D9M71_561480 [compost metagenome]